MLKIPIFMQNGNLMKIYENLLPILIHIYVKMYVDSIFIKYTLKHIGIPYYMLLMTNKF